VAFASSVGHSPLGPLTAAFRYRRIGLRCLVGCGNFFLACFRFIRRRPWGFPFAAFLPSGRHLDLRVHLIPLAVCSSVLLDCFCRGIDSPPKTLCGANAPYAHFHCCGLSIKGRSNRDFRGSSFSTSRIAPYRADLDCTVSPDYWEGNFVGDRAADGSEYLRVNLKGYGAYAGLQLRMEQWADAGAPYFTVSGEVLHPGNK